MFKKNEEKKEMSKRELKKLQRKINLERQRINLMKQQQQLAKERRAVEYPRMHEAVKTAKGTWHNFTSFAERVATAGAGSYATMNKAIKKRKKTAKSQRIKSGTVNYAMRGYRSPSGDISLSGAIAQETWSGPDNFATREFFGEREERDLIGDRNKEVNIGSNFNREFFSSNVKNAKSLIGDTNKNINLDVFKSGKKKLI